MRQNISGEIRVSGKLSGFVAFDNSLYTPSQLRRFVVATMGVANEPRVGKH